MQNYPLTNILVPAIFASSIVFSILTLPAVLLKSEPLVIDLGFLRWEIQPLFDGNNNDQAIRYVGFSILSSTAAGLATVEMQRRIGATTNPENLGKASLQTNAQSDVDSADLPVAVINNEEELARSENLDFETLVQAFETIDATKTPTAPPAEKANSLELSLVTDNYDLTAAELADFSSQSTLLDVSSVYDQILASPEQYQNCRITVPNLHQSLLAILFEGRYYSFLKSEKNVDKLLEVISKLDYEINNIVITKTSKNYALWIWEPEAEPM